MALINDIIEIHSGYSDNVDLKNDFQNDSLNKERMANYRPIKSHRDAFSIIAESPFKKDSKRCFILSGSFGTGKSHLCLMAANYFSIPSTTPEIESFFKLYKEAEEEEKKPNKKSEIFKNIRRTGKFLVCICDYQLNTNFETIVLRSIKDAFQREDIDINEINSLYLQAYKKIVEWENSSEQYFINKFANELESEYPNWTVNKIKKALQEYDREAANIFKEIHKKITTADFELSSDNLIDIIKQISESKIIKERFRGIVIFFDEFDYQIQNKRFELNTFQKFGKMCEDSFMDNFPILFVATTHRSFVSYKTTYNDADFKTVSDRVYEIAMVTNGIEDIISAIVVPKKKSVIWEKEIKPHRDIFNQSANECHSLKIFDWLSIPKLRDKIIENIYPMHPIATYALIRLSLDLGSNNRSVFKFFSSQNGESGSYVWFIRNHDILNSRGELQLYTVDNLYSYFENKITSDNTELRNTVKDIVRNYETSVREYNKYKLSSENFTFSSEIYMRILKTMVIFNIIDLPVNLHNIGFGLNLVNQTEGSELEYCLNDLSKKKIIFKNEQMDYYEFRRSDALDIRGLIKSKKQESSVPENIFQEIENIIKSSDVVKNIRKFFKDTDYLVASGYNQNYIEDKRFKIKFTTLKDFENKDYFDNIESEINNNQEKDGYDGIAVYITCETEDEVRRAKIMASTNDNERIIIAVPLNEIPILDEVFTLKVAVSIDTNDLSTQDLSMLNEIISQYDKNLGNGLRNYLDSKNLIFYGVNGTILSQNDENNHEAIDKAMYEIYNTLRNKIKHEELNLKYKFKGKNDSSLRNAIENILDISKDISFNNASAADSGDRRYIRNVLFNYGVLKEVSKSENRIVCQLNNNVDNYKIEFPALVDMVKSISESKEDINILKFIDCYIYKYGLGYNSIILFFAVVLRYFKDNIMIIPDVNEIGNLKVQSYDTLLDLIYQKKYKSAVIRYKELSKYQRMLINELYKAFNNEYDANTAGITIDEVFNTIRNWYMSLTPVNKVKSVYESSKLDTFIDTFNRVDNVNSHDFVLEGIKLIYGYQLDSLLLEDDIKKVVESFKKDKVTIERGYYIVKEYIFKQLKVIFNIDAVTEDGFMERLKKWYEGLTNIQRDFNTNLQDDESEPIARLFGTSFTFEQLFMEQLPGNSGYKYGMVKNWTEDRRENYISAIKHGKQHIERICIVEIPDYNYDSKNVKKNKLGENDVDLYYNDLITLTITPKATHQYVYLTSNGDDPRKPDSQRQEYSKAFNFSTSDNKIIKFVARDAENRYSNVITIKLVNERKKYEVTIAKGMPIQISINEHNLNTTNEENDFKVETILPKDKESLKICFKSLINSSTSKYDISKNDLKAVLQEILNEM